MTTIDVTLTDGDYDAHERDNGSSYDDSGTICIVRANSSSFNRFHAGIMFDVTIPGGATIDVAYLSVTPQSASNDDVDCDIYCEDVDDADTFAVTADVIGRTKTTASVSWVSTGLGTSEVDTPELKTVVQEVVDRAGRADSFTLCFLLWGTGDSSNQLRFFSADNGSDYPKLHIEYTAAGGDEFGAVDFAGSGQLTAAGEIEMTGAVDFAGSGQLTAAGEIEMTGAVALNAAGTMTAAGFVETPGSDEFGAVALNAAGTMTAAGVRDLPGAVALNAAGTMTAAGEIEMTGAVFFNAAGTMTAAGQLDGDFSPLQKTRAAVKSAVRIGVK